MPFLALFLSVLVAKGIGQFQFSVSTNQSYESNPFRFVNNEASWVADYNFNLQYDFTGFLISYQGNYNFFAEFADRNFYQQQFSGFKRSESYETGFYFQNRINDQLYDFYDYSTLSLYLNKRFNPEFVLVFFNADAAYNNYNELQDLNHLLLTGAIKLQKSFATRSTIIAGFGYKYKYYLNTLVVGQEAAGVQYSILGNGYGQGGPGMRGREYPGMGYSDSLSVYFSQVPALSVSQLNWYVRMAQSVFDNTGFAVQYSQSILADGNNRDVAGLTYNYADESQFFDDPMGYEQKTAGAELTQILPAFVQLKAGYYFTHKDYAVQNRYIDDLTLDDSNLRSDDRNIFWLTLLKRFNIHIMGAQFLSASFDFQKLINKSNSYFYNYQNTSFNFSLSLEF